MIIRSHWRDMNRGTPRLQGPPQGKNPAWFRSGPDLVGVWFPMGLLFLISERGWTVVAVRESLISIF
jgi:hypothetical protein